MKSITLLLAILLLLTFTFTTTVKAGDHNIMTAPSGLSINDVPDKTSDDPVEDAFQRKIFNGLTAGSQFGNSVSSAGDVNGDGYDDIIAGAHGYNSFTGRAYIYFGGQNMNTAADITLTGITSGGFFGYSVASAGDVNGDGYSDVIASAYAYNSNTGRVYIYFGGASMNNTADIILTGDTVNCYFGISVSSAGDINSDGFSDVVVGANGYNGGKGRTYLYLGGSSMNNVADVIMYGEAPGNNFGLSVASAGDVNADGYSDVIIGATGYNTGTGRSYVFFGGNSVDNVPDVIMTGAASNNNFGASVSSAGDINGDGYADVIVGAYGINAFTGKAYVYLGGASMDNTADMTVTGEATLGYFGASVSSAGDMNGDGFSDIIVGAYGMNTNTGKIYVYFGGEAADTVSDLSVSGEASNNYFGTSVALTGDVNGDGYPEVISGAKGYNSFTGRAYYYDYYMRNEIMAELVMTGEASNNYFGFSVSSAGDVNGDSYDDFIAGAYSYNSLTGRAYIYYGGVSSDNIADVVLTGEASSRFGGSVKSAGDVNGDGYADVIVGARQYNSYTGRAYIYFGGNPMDNVADVILTGSESDIYFGSSVSSGGDLNGDGYSDVVVGAPEQNSADGSVYVFFGGASMDNVPDKTLNGETLMTGTFGSSVSEAGDVNGDGYDDLVVAASNINSSTGKVYLFYGGSSMDIYQDVTFSGEYTYSSFGNTLASAGDVNGDGYSDLIIGSDGKAFIFFGGGVVNNVADRFVYGETGTFGNIVSGAGDVNADGYSDVIIADNQNNSATGKAYIYFGSVSMDDVPDSYMSGENVQDRFGISVASAGDINGDGYSDIIAGAYDYGTVRGRMYVYTGSAISVKPVLLSIKDVPHDQGGYVDLKWARSSYDVNGVDIITGYNIERSNPPSGGSFTWVNVANIPATKNSFYSYLASTPYDSAENTSGTFFFRVTAVTNSPSQYWRSAILSGRSVDNISPPVVSPFNAFSESSGVRLTWKRNSAPDLMNYILFRSTSPSIDPYSEPPFASLTDSTYLDPSPLIGTYYYFIVAQDIHNNFSPVASVQSPESDKKLFTFGAIQGLYNSFTNLMIHDTVTVYLRNAVSPFERIDSSRKLLYGPGTGQEFSFSNAQNGIPYYIEVKHRNSIRTWSADPVTFIGDHASIAFSVDAAYAYGSNQIKVDSDPYDVYAFYSGDVNQDGAINLSDIVSVYNNSSGFVNGYVSTDLNGDNITNLADLVLTYNNSAKFVQVIRP